MIGTPNHTVRDWIPIGRGIPGWLRGHFLDIHRNTSEQYLAISHNLLWLWVQIISRTPMDTPFHHWDFGPQSDDKSKPIITRCHLFPVFLPPNSGKWSDHKPPGFWGCLGSECCLTGQASSELALSFGGILHSLVAYGFPTFVYICDVWLLVGWDDFQRWWMV